MRFVDPEAPRVSRHLVASEADLALVRRHHAIFYGLVLMAPLEWWLRGRPAGMIQIAGVGLALGGVVGYRWAGRALGDQLSPLVAPAEPAVLVVRGPYRHLRHPMYLAELALAFGVPLMLGVTWTLVPSALFAVAILHRIGVEERAVAARLPAYPDYAARTSRLIPHVF